MRVIHRILIALLTLIITSIASALDLPVLPESTNLKSDISLFESNEPSQEAWKALLTAILVNDAEAVQRCGLQILGYDNPTYNFTLCRLGFLFEDFANNPARLMQELESLPSSQVPACQVERDELVMRLAARSLQVEKCELMAQKLGYIRQWALLGDINAQGRTDLESSWGPEKKPDPHGLVVAGISRRWFYPSSPANGWVNLSNIIIPNEGVVYALTYFQIPTAQDILITWELEGSGMLYVDGRMLFRIDPTAAQPNRICSAVISLEPGFHRLVIKSIPLPLWFSRQGYDWGFRLKLTTPKFETPSGLELSTDIACEKSLAPATPLKLLSAQTQKYDSTKHDQFATLMESFTALATGNLTQAESLLRQLDTGFNHSALTNWLYAQALLFHAEPTFRMQAASEISQSNGSISQPAGIRLLKNRLWLENQSYEKVIDDLGFGNANQTDFNLLLGIAESRSGLVVPAEKHLRQSADEGSGYAALELARLLLEQGRQKDAASLITQTISTDLGMRTQMNGLYDVWINQRPKEAYIALSKCLRLAPYDLLLHEATLESTLTFAALPDALAQAREMIRNHPFAENGYRRLAELSIFTYEQDAGKNAALELSRLRSGNDWSEQYLNSLALGSNQTVVDFTKEEALASNTPPDPQSKVIYLSDDIYYMVRDDYSFDEVIRRALRLETDDVRDQYGEIALPDGAELLAAVVLTPDSERHNAAIISDPSGSATISFRGLETGCIIEYAWLTHYSKRRINNLPCFYYFAHGFASTAYRLCDSRIVVDAPVRIPIHSLVTRFPGSFTTQHHKGRTVYTWEVKNQPRIVPEPDMPSAFYIGPVAQGSSLPNLDAINEWLWGEIAPSLLSDEQVDNRAITIASNARSLEEKAALIFRYVDRHVERINGTILNPVPAHKTLIYHWGRGIDRAILMIAMLRAVGVDSYLALLNSSPDLPGEETHPTMAYYDYALIYIPNQSGKEIWLDPNIPYIGFGLIFEGIMDKEAMVFLGSDFVRKRTPQENSEPALTEINLQLTLTAEGWAEGKGTITWSGLDGLARSSFTDPHTREKDAESIVQSYFEEATISATSLEHLDEPDKPLICYFRNTIPHLALTSIRGLEVTSGMLKRSLCRQFITLSKRKHPLILDRSFRQNDQYEVQLPSDSTVNPTKGIQQVYSKFGDYKLEWIFISGKLIVNRMIKIPAQTISPSNYRGFAEFCRSVDEKDLTPIEIKLE